MAVIIIFSLLLLILPFSAKAVCPVCAVAVAAGVGLSQWLGIDDAITGLWIGGLTVAMIIWTINWLNKKNIRFFGRQPLVAAGFYFLMIWPLYYLNLVGHAFNKIWGYDKLLAGITVGSLAFIAGVVSYEYLKKRHNGQAYFPFQKVAMPVGALAIASLVFYLILR